MKRLFPLETDREKLDQARDKLLSVQSDAEGKEPTVETLSALATQFAEKRFVSVCTFIRTYVLVYVHSSLHTLVTEYACMYITYTQLQYVSTYVYYIQTVIVCTYVCTYVCQSTPTYTEDLNTCT